MRLSPKRFNRHLNHMGQDFAWRRAYACPCVNPHSGSPKPACPNCAGKGRLWDAAVEGKAGIVGRDQMKAFAAFGMWDQGDIMLSIPSDSPLYGIGQFDRVAASNRSEPFSLNLVRGVNDLIRFPILSIERVFWLVNEVPTDASPVSLLPDGRIQWGELAPPINATYSVTGRRTPEYFCYTELPADRPMHFGETLPRRVALRRFDLFGR